MLFAAACPAGAEVVEAIAAVVNGKVITRSEVEGEMAKIGAMNSDDAARRSVLESLIELELLKERADKSGINITDADIDDAINQLTRRNNTDPLSFRQAVTSQGISWEAYREGLGNQILQMRVFSVAMRQELKLDDDRLEQYYLANAELFGEPPSVRLLYISTKPGTGEAALVKKSVDEGEDFEAAAKRITGAGPTDTGMLGVKGLNASFSKAIAGLKVGELSDVVVTPDGDYLLKLVERAAPKLPVFEEVRDEVQKRFTSAGEIELYRNWIEQLKRQAKIQRMP